MTAAYVTLAYAAGLGLIVGSFLNVCIWRLPREESVVFPRSHCTRCNASIQWFDNIPVLSWILLRGKCRSCGEKFSVRYALVEILTAGVFVFCHELFFKHAEYANTAAFLYFFCALIVITFIDIDHYLILDVVTFPGMALCLALALWGHRPLTEETALARLGQSALGLLAGGGILWAVQFLGALWYRRQSLEAMGLGDVKLAALTGAFLGPKPEMAALLLAVFIGGALAILLMLAGLKGRKDYIPFGPAIAAGAALAPFFGDFVLSLYHVSGG